MFPTLKKVPATTLAENSERIERSAQDIAAEKISDEELMLAYAKNDQLAFNQLYERYRVSLYRYMYKRISISEAILNELYQDVWLKLINSRKQYQVKASFKTFLYQIANNTIKDYFRRESVRKIVSNLDDDTEIADSSLLPEEQAEEKRMMKNFHQALNALPHEQRDVFLLREESGLTSQQIADVLGVSVDTVKSRMRYAVIKLKATIN